jgi:hypothetical protein
MEFTPQQITWCVVWYGMYGSQAEVLRKYRTRFGRSATKPNGKTILNWWNKIKETGNLGRKKKEKTR